MLQYNVVLHHRGSGMTDETRHARYMLQLTAKLDLPAQFDAVTHIWISKECPGHWHKSMWLRYATKNMLHELAGFCACIMQYSLCCTNTKISYTGFAV